MAVLRWLITCQRVITDQATNSVSYIDAVEGVVLPTLPHPLMPFIVAMTWDRENRGEKIVVRVRILDPDQNVFAELAPIVLEHADASRHRANLMVTPKTDVTQPGYYFVTVEHLVDDEWHPDGAVPLEVVVAQTDDQSSDEEQPAPPIEAPPE